MSPVAIVKILLNNKRRPRTKPWGLSQISGEKVERNPLRGLRRNSESGRVCGTEA